MRYTVEHHCKHQTALLFVDITVATVEYTACELHYTTLLNVTARIAEATGTTQVT